MTHHHGNHCQTIHNLTPPTSLMLKVNRPGHRGLDPLTSPAYYVINGLAEIQFEPVISFSTVWRLIN